MWCLLSYTLSFLPETYSMAGSKRKLSVLFVTSEIFPLIKTGGLADVSAALPNALQALGVDIRVLVPGYPDVLAAIKKKIDIVTWKILGQEVHVFEATLPQFEFPLIVASADIFSRPGNPYVDSNKNDWPDNALRFGILAHIGARLSCHANGLGWQPDIVHCNDWQTGLIPALLHFEKNTHAASLMTIHNLSFQGIFPSTFTQILGLPEESFNIEGVEYYNQLSFLKAGIYFADQLTTVSASYAQEIQTRAFGCGMHGLLSQRQDVLKGIVNGIDTKTWNPQQDIYLPFRYGPDSLQEKLKNKAALQSRIGLNISDGILFGIVSRLTAQKGLDLVLEVAPRIIKRGGQLAILGNGNIDLQQQFLALAKTNPRVVHIETGYDEALAHLIEAGADSFLMPSRFEPCGLNQMYSMHYGTPPIVRATGGLNDTVSDANPRTIENGGGTGFVFAESSVEDFWDAIQRAFNVYGNKALWQRLQQNGMNQDFSWQRSAREYFALYRTMLTPGSG